MRHCFRAVPAALLCAALSTAAVAAPAAAPATDPPKPAVAAAGTPTAADPAPAKPAAAAHPAVQALRADPAKRRAAFRHRLAHLHDRAPARAPVRVAALDVLPPVRPARLVDMTAQRDGVLVRPESVQVARPVAQSSACDSLLCSSYIILGAGF